MPTLLYIHGFLSSPLSHKAQTIKHWLQQHRPNIDYSCPVLSPYPERAAQQLDEALAHCEGDVYLMGSSLGGFWATYLAERYGHKAVLINPAVAALELIPNYLGQRLKNYHLDEYYTLRAEHMQQLARFDVPRIEHPELFWLLAQQGDEVLDYRLAEAKFAQSLRTIEAGGDHGFMNFERHIVALIEFFETPA